MDGAHANMALLESCTNPMWIVLVMNGYRPSLTKFSKTHLFNFHSAGRHCQSCWLLSSRHVQCLRNSSRHDLLMSAILRWRFDPRIHVSQSVSTVFPILIIHDMTLSFLSRPLSYIPIPNLQTGRLTYTLRAHRVTLRPSFKHSNSPFPGFSFLHCIKSSL